MRSFIQHIGSDLYTRSHYWVDFHSRKCGLTPYFFEVIVPHELAYEASIKTGRVRMGERVGTVYSFCSINREIVASPIHSPITGIINKINTKPVQGDFWLYEVKKVEQYNEELTDYFTYQAQIMALKE